jgi:hypothetical protein
VSLRRARTLSCRCPEVAPIVILTIPPGRPENSLMYDFVKSSTQSIIGLGRLMKRHRPKAREDDPLVRAWCPACETYAFLVDGKLTCRDPSFAPPRALPVQKLRHVRRCSWPACTASSRR